MLIETDWSCNLYICDLVRSLELTPKAAMTVLRKRLSHENQNVVLHSLKLLETMMKNCGSPMHEEVAQRENIRSLTQLTSSTPPVRHKLLELIQNWAFVFKGQSAYQEIQDLYDSLKSLGFTFPPFSESDAMFSTECAPNWKDGETCHRCKVSFTAFRRKHHCRNCGNVFCGDCTSMKAMIPRFGFENEVRVCDSCHEQINRLQTQGNKPTSETSSNQVCYFRAFYLV
ncbi:unnamed protein product [Protopolystoma xenopodis]|uniref:Hepatocyte growth factor-regulated tyrosine kinase substrate n=1 Tax=Protopolystoma xenopodis TaxID=117903 RepID=A0A3S5FES7_9PLAT|nr:unnamed protein product [Protopolystoma xenopodis]